MVHDKCSVEDSENQVDLSGISGFYSAGIAVGDQDHRRKKRKAWWQPSFSLFFILSIAGA